MSSIRLPFIVLLLCALVACGAEQTQKYGVAERDISIWPRPDNPLSSNKRYSFEQEVTDLLAQMTLEQKVGQMVSVNIKSISPREIKKYHIGGVLNGGNTYANNNRDSTVADWVKAVDDYYMASMDTSDGGIAIPIIWGTDAVHGHNKVIGATIFPHNIGLGAARNPELMHRIGEITALEMLVTAVDWNFAPSVAVVRDDRWGRTYESYSEDPEIVKELSRPYIEGLQGVAGSASFMGDNKVFATAKHFIGDGGTEEGIDRGNNIASETQLFKIHGEGYVSAINAGVLSVMPSHSMWQGRRMHGHQYLLTDVLKQRMGFDGFYIGDWNSHGLVRGCTNASCPQSINAGLDMLMLTDDWKAFVRNTVQQVKDGIIPEARINDAVSRILRAKFRAGLFTKGRPSQRKYSNKTELFGSIEHRKVARQAARESLVLLKNNNNILPLHPKMNVLVAGDGAHNISQQTGGWTITWSGKGNKNSDFPGGTSFLDGIRRTVENAGGTVVYDKKGRYKNKPDVAIVAFGEEPYAEWFGDIKHLSYQRLRNKNARLLEKLQKAGIPTITLFISGRPLWVNRVINASEAFVATWLPGSEGIAIADVLFRQADGSIHYDFTGKLSFSWPMYPSQTRLNRGAEGYKPLFPYGYGLTYQDKKTIAKLELREDIPESAKDPTLVIFNGRAVIPWFLRLTDEEGFTTYLGGGVERQHLTARETDKTTQGDAVELEWLGTGPGSFVFANPPENQDYSYYLQEKSAYVMDLYPIEAPSSTLLLSAGRYEEPAKSLDISKAINRLKPGSWQQFSVDIQCMQKLGVDYLTINSPFALTSEGKAKLRIANIRILPAMGEKATISCSQ